MLEIDCPAHQHEQTSGNGYTKIYSTERAFATLKADGSIMAWGDSKYGGSGAPSDNGYTKIYSNFQAFAALKANGSITACHLNKSRYSHHQRAHLCLHDSNHPKP
jgi:hypothetical protein